MEKRGELEREVSEWRKVESSRHKESEGRDFTGGGMKWPDEVSSQPDSQYPWMWGAVSALVCALILVL